MATWKAKLFLRKNIFKDAGKIYSRHDFLRNCVFVCQWQKSPFFCWEKAIFHLVKKKRSYSKLLACVQNKDLSFNDFHSETDRNWHRLSSNFIGKEASKIQYFQIDTPDSLQNRIVFQGWKWCQKNIDIPKNRSCSSWSLVKNRKMIRFCQK